MDVPAWRDTEFRISIQLSVLLISLDKVSSIIVEYKIDHALEGTPHRFGKTVSVEIGIVSCCGCDLSGHVALPQDSHVSFCITLS